jgi:hypothetical protein
VHLLSEIQDGPQHGQATNERTAVGIDGIRQVLHGLVDLVPRIAHQMFDEDEVSHRSLISLDNGTVPAPLSINLQIPLSSFTTLGFSLSFTQSLPKPFPLD